MNEGIFWSLSPSLSVAREESLMVEIIE
jgi:hypothetical protein